MTNPNVTPDHVSGQPYQFTSLIDERREVITDPALIDLLQRYGDHSTFTLTALTTPPPPAALDGGK